MPIFKLSVTQVTTTREYFSIEAESLQAAKTAWEASVEAETVGEPDDIDVSDDETQVEWEDDDTSGDVSDGDVLVDICREACDDIELSTDWVPFIADMVNDTNGVYGSAGMFDPNVATDYANMLAKGIDFRLAHGESEIEICQLDFATLYGTME